MTITDLTDNYVSSILKGKNVEEYYNSCPFLFEHYFEFWGDKNYKPEITDSGILLRNRDLILKSLEKISVILQRNNADTVYLQVSQGLMVMRLSMTTKAMHGLLRNVTLRNCIVM